MTERGLDRVFDTLIRNGKLVDGSGTPWRYADVGVTGNTIVAVDRHLSGDARKVIDADGKIVCPGFIDIHSHADTAIIRSPGRIPKVTQGVTTEVFSNCGLGAAPVNEAGRAAILDYNRGEYDGLDFDWLSVDEYLGKIPLSGVNVAYLIPHGGLRASAMGYAGRPAGPGEIEVMRRLLDEGMASGAFGMSTGLAYVPMSSATTKEVIALCRVVARYGGLLACHVRNEREGLIDGVREMARVARETGVPVEISHYATMGACHTADELLQEMLHARAQGCDLTYDSYPYVFGAGFLRNTIPAKYHKDGVTGLVSYLKDPGLRDTLRKEVGVLSTYDLTKLVITSVTNPSFANLIGKSLPEGAKERDQDILDFLCDILSEDTGVCHANFSGNPEDVKVLARSPLHMVASDSLDVIPGRGKAHPRLYGTFTRFLRLYVMETPLLTWEQAIWKMTGLPAWRMGFRARGIVRPGFAADLVILDPSNVSDRASLESPELTSTGIDWVIVNGVVEVANGEVTGELGGSVLRKGDA